MKVWRVLLAFFLLAFPISEAKSVELIGAGATFPYPLYSKLFFIYQNETGIKVNYQAIGSGGGIRQLINKTVDFGATDSPLTEKELEEAGAPILHIPTCLGALVLAFNLPKVEKLNLTGKVIADIYLGKIKKWNDPEIAKLNPEVNLLNMNITPVYRSDGSGSTYIFSQYLSKVSQEWKEKVGVGKSLKWPTGVGGKGNPGVAGIIKQIPGSIGYIEFVYAVQSKISFASIENKEGRFIYPSVETITASASSNIPENAIVDLTDTQAPNGYPISSFTWIVVYKEQNYGERPREKAIELAKLLWWMIHEGQKYAQELSYSPLPHNAVEVAEKLIKSMTYKGEPLLK